MAKATGGRKSNEIDYEQKMIRVFEVMLYEKKSYTEFKEQMAKEFEISTRAAENMWFDARTRLKERFSQEREEVLSEQLNRLYSLLNRCRESGNRRIEAEVLRDINKIYGLDSPQKVDLTSNGETIAVNIILNND